MKATAFEQMGIYLLKGDDWLLKQRIAGKAVATALSALIELVNSKTGLTTLELNNVAEDIIADHGCLPTFKNYRGFPSACCISVNKHLVHGIPDNYRLQEGDLVSFDLGATYDGAIGDSAVTVIYGEPKNQEHVRLIRSTENALAEAIKSIAIDKRLGVIGETIYKIGKSSGYGVVTDLGGHHLDWNTPHSDPFVSNRDNADNGMRIQRGMSLCIEPLLCIGMPRVKRLSDGWTIETEGLSAHFEHTLYVHEDRVEIMTDRSLP